MVGLFGGREKGFGGGFVGIGGQMSGLVAWFALFDSGRRDECGGPGWRVGFGRWNNMVRMECGLEQGGDVTGAEGV